MWPRSFVSTLIPTPHPPCSGPSSRSAGSETSVKNTSSNSAEPVIWRSGRTSMPGRSIGQRKNEMPSCFARVGIGARHEDAPVAHPPAGAPHLLAVDDEAVAVLLGPRGERSEVAAGAGLGEQLAPHVVGAERGAQVLVLLRRRAVAQDRPAGEHEADHVQHRRHPGAGALDQPRCLVVVAQPAAAVLDGPVDPGVAGLEQPPLPRHAGVDQLGRADGAVVGRRNVTVGIQPVAPRPP